MFESEYFIMMNNQRGDAIFPMEDESDDVCLFATYEAAKKMGDAHAYCEAFGYEIFCRGCGEIG